MYISNVSWWPGYFHSRQVMDTLSLLSSCMTCAPTRVHCKREGARMYIFQVLSLPMNKDALADVSCHATRRQDLGTRNR